MAHTVKAYMSEAQGRSVNNPRFGVQHHSAKLTENKVATIRDRVSKGESMRKLAKEYGVSPTTINRIVAHKTWSFVAGDGVTA